MLTGHPVPGKRKSADIIAAFIAGAPRDAEGSVFYGVTEGNVLAWQLARKSGAPWFYIDNSYFDQARGVQYRVTESALQHTGIGHTNTKRFLKLGIRVEPAREGGEFTLALPQSDAFMRLVADHSPDWLEEELRHIAGPTMVRPWSSNKSGIQTTLRADLMLARKVLTYSSAGAVTAVLAGVRVRCSPQCAAWRFSDKLRSNDEPVASIAERLRWAGVLADNQFSLDELRNGKAWEMLNG